MSIVVHDSWDLSEKGKKDAERHRHKIDDAIRKSVKDVIGEESIITRKGQKTVKIPVKGLKDFRFIYGNNNGGEGSGGVGQGEGQGGDVIDSQPTDGDGDDGEVRRAGECPGIDYIETEVDIDYLIQVMFEDLGLPWIEEKTKAQQMIPKGWKFETISKKGIMPRLHKKRTMVEAVKRMVMYESEIVDECNVSEDDAAGL